MNNTKPNRLKNDWFSKNANFGQSSRNKIRETALYILEGSIESNYSKETAIKNLNFDLKSMNNTKPNSYLALLGCSYGYLGLLACYYGYLALLACSYGYLGHLACSYGYLGLSAVSLAF